MFFKIIIDQTAALEWGLNLTEACLFDFCYRLPSWADPVLVEGKAYFWASKTKVMEEVPILTDKPDTIYRIMRHLVEKGVIEYLKAGRKDLVRLTEKGKAWGRANSEKNPSSETEPDNSEKNPDLDANSEKNPSKLGKKSELNSEKNPTDNTISNKDNKNKKEKPQAESLHALCRGRFDFFNQKRADRIKAGYVPLYWNKKEIGSLSNLIRMLQNSAAAKGVQITSHAEFVEKVFDVFCELLICSNEWFAETFTPSGMVSNYNKIVQSFNNSRNGKRNKPSNNQEALSADAAGAILEQLNREGY